MTINIKITMKNAFKIERYAYLKVFATCSTFMSGRSRKEKGKQKQTTK